MCIAICFAIAILASIWPDVDIKSTSQVIFYRLFAVVNIVLIFLKMYVYSAFLGFFAMLPMLGKHRGWTHSRITMLLLPAILTIAPYYLQNNTQRGATFSLDEVGTADVYPHSQGGYMLRPWVGTRGTVKINFGGYTSFSISSAAADTNGYGSFEYAPPSGYYALCTKNIAEYG